MNVTRDHKFLSEYRKNLYVSKNFDAIVRFQSVKREHWIREIRGEKLQGIAEGASIAPHLASPSAASFVKRNV